MRLPVCGRAEYQGGMRPLRPLLAHCLALVLCLGAVASGFARGQSPAVARVTICASGGEATLALDAEGRPVDPHRHCPDCLILKSTLPLTASAPLVRAVWRVAARRPAPSIGSGADPAMPRARGPPAST
jgi:hypothetical protein